MITCAPGRFSTIWPRRIEMNSDDRRNSGISSSTSCFQTTTNGSRARVTKRVSVEAFSEIIEGETPDDVDDQLKAIRQRLTEFLPDHDLDFYWEPTTTCWYTEGESEILGALPALLHIQAADSSLRSARNWQDLRFFSIPGTSFQNLSRHARTGSSFIPVMVVTSSITA